ncbi:MAG TPA: peptide chain release factor-like protein [Phycisphaerae bacterium]|nr:peptide chain release factor-like protein [Phycisphaerae bacterium]
MNKVSATTRDAWLAMDDGVLLRECDVDTYRASGPGGQKRNKTSSAVRLRHAPSGLMSIAEESRSQHENKAKALKRLRWTIAFDCRQPTTDRDALMAQLQSYRSPEGGLRIPRRAPDLPLLIARVLDVLEAASGGLQSAAAGLSLTTSQLSKLLVNEGKVLAAANHIRARHGLKPLRTHD